MGYFLDQDLDSGSAFNSLMDLVRHLVKSGGSESVRIPKINGATRNAETLFSQLNSVPSSPEQIHHVLKM